MKTFKRANVSEQELEDLTRRYAGMIEEGLVYVDHQKQTTSGRLDVLLVDSGGSLVVAELKVVEDDGMLVQGLDYLDFVSTNLETYSRLYARGHTINPTQQVRLLLIAPSFSQTLINRCKWLSAEIKLFTFNCLRFDGEDEVIPVFSEQAIPTPPPRPEIVTIQDHLNYITDEPMRCRFSDLLDEIKNWKPGNVSLDSISFGVSVRVNGRVFCYLKPQRKNYVIETRNSDNEWTNYSIRSDDDLANAKNLAKDAMERREKEGLRGQSAFPSEQM
jgi:hypothetical protein